jgi:hypothetical protein
MKLAAKNIKLCAWVGSGKPHYEHCFKAAHEHRKPSVKVSVKPSVSELELVGSGSA